MNYSPESLKALRKQLNLTQAEMGEKLALTKEMINKMEAGTKPISAHTQLKLMNLENLLPKTKISEPAIGYEQKFNNDKLIPFYDAEAQAGNTLDMDMIPVTEPQRMIDVGDLLRDSECAIRIYGNSMVPNYPSGCVVGLRENRDGIVEYGNVYVIETSDNRYLKRLFKDKTGKGYLCYSDNTMTYTDGPRRGEPAYEPFVIAFDVIRRIYRVTGVIKRNENSAIYGRASA